MFFVLAVCSSLAVVLGTEGGVRIFNAEGERGSSGVLCDKTGQRRCCATRTTLCRVGARHTTKNNDALHIKAEIIRTGTKRLSG